jgi:hypothetical protein
LSETWKLRQGLTSRTTLSVTTLTTVPSNPAPRRHVLLGGPRGWARRVLICTDTSSASRSRLRDDLSRLRGYPSNILRASNHCLSRCPPVTIDFS